MKRSAALRLAVAVLATACGPADEVEVQPLPPLEQVSAEARAGLPEISGTWRFAGWELAPNDSASLALPLPRFGALDLQTQKRDSLAGRYLVQAGAAPLYGEVRRDSVIALVGVFGPGDLRYLTGRLDRDTVWVELSSLTEQERWPADARAAFVRAQVDSPFVRLRGALPPVAVADTTPAPPVAGTAPPAGGAAVATPGAVSGTAPRTVPGQTPAGTATPRPTTPRPGATPATGGAVTQPRTTPTPTPVRPAMPTPAPPAQEEEEEPEEEAPPVPLLGEPAVDDTTGF